MGRLDNTVKHLVDKLTEDAAVLQHAIKVVARELATQHTLNPIPTFELKVGVHVNNRNTCESCGRMTQTLRRAIWMSKIWMRVLVGRRSRRRFMSWTSPVSALVTSGSIASISACDIFVGWLLCLSLAGTVKRRCCSKECVWNKKKSVKKHKKKQKKTTTQISVFLV